MGASKPKTALNRSREEAERRAGVVEFGRGLPEAVDAAIGRLNEHIAFSVRKKIFAYYLFDHHGDGRIALWCKAAPGEQGRLVKKDPRRYFVPPYVGPRGWVGVRLDLGRVSWKEIEYLLGMAYEMTAPRSLVRRLKEEPR